MILAACASCVSIKSGKGALARKTLRLAASAAREVKNFAAWATAPIKNRRSYWEIGLATALGAGLRIYFLFQPMRHDESFTFLRYVNQSLWRLFLYIEPNNHILHTLLVRFSVSIFGKDPVFIRLPAVTAAVLCIPAVYCLTRLTTGSRKNGLTAALLASVFPYIILLDAMARGYSILVLLSLLLAMMGLRYIEKPSLALCVIMSVTASLGVFDIPTFLFPGFGLFFWIGFRAWKQGMQIKSLFREFAFPCILMTGLGTFFLYTPTIIVTNGLYYLTNNVFVRPLPWVDFASRLPEHFVETAQQLTCGIPAAASGVLLILLIVGLTAFAKTGVKNGFWLFPIMCLISLCLLIAKHAIPFPRTWSFLLPFAFIAVDMGYTTLTKNLGAVRSKAVLAIVGGVAAAAVIIQDPITGNPETGLFSEAPVLVEYLSEDMKKNDVVRALLPAVEPMSFYMQLHNFPSTLESPEPGSAGRTFFVVKTSEYSLDDLTDSQAELVLKTGDAELYVAPGV